MENGSPSRPSLAVADEAEEELAWRQSLSLSGFGCTVGQRLPLFGVEVLVPDPELDPSPDFQPVPYVRQLSFDNIIMKLNLGLERVMKLNLGPERVYDCMTCSRSFRSSQALERHCTSHRRRLMRKRKLSDLAAAAKRELARVVREVDTDRRGQRKLLPSSSQQNNVGYGTSATDLEAGLNGAPPDNKQPSVNAPISAERCNSWESGGYYWRTEYTSHPGVLNLQGYTPTNLLAAANGGGRPGHLESRHGEADLEAGGEQAIVWCYEDADPDFGSCQAKELHEHLESVLSNEPVSVKAGPNLVEEEEEAKTLKHFFIQLYATLLPASAMAYPVLKDAPKHVRIVTFGGLVVIISIVLFAGILSRSLAHRRLGFWLVSCAALALLIFSFTSQLS